MHEATEQDLFGVLRLYSSSALRSEKGTKRNGSLPAGEGRLRDLHARSATTADVAQVVFMG